MLTLIQTPTFMQATYTIFGGSTGANLFTDLLYRVFGVISFVGVILFIVFSCNLIISNIKFNNK